MFVAGVVDDLPLKPHFRRAAAIQVEGQLHAIAEEQLLQILQGLTSVRLQQTVQKPMRSLASVMAEANAWALAGSMSRTW